MIACSDFYNVLRDSGVSLFAGVPDSLLKDFCAYVTDTVPGKAHCITANEGAAVALAAGHHLATGGLGLVYLQNSGLGNIVNPLTSLVDPEVYSIPALLLIGWRGEPGVHDEPQHVKQGKNMLAVLDALSVPYGILPDEIEGAKALVARATEHMKSTNSPFAIIVRKGTFTPYKLKQAVKSRYTLKREAAIETILGTVEDNGIVVSTTGMISREVFESRARANAGHHRDFLTVGSMGHSSQIALGIALEKPDRPVYCIDGDGALLMHMGSGAVLAAMQPKNLTHIVLNNGAHDSVGGQPTVGFQVDLLKFAEAVGYKASARVTAAEAIAPELKKLTASEGPRLLEVRIAVGSRPDLGRPTTTPQENKRAFMNYIQSA